MFGTYRPEDVTLLLKDITGLVEPLSTEEREKRIQSGVHYSEMLPKEYRPSPAYFRAYQEALERYADITAGAVVSVGEKLWRAKGEKAVLVSLARAGTPIGILIKHYIEKKYHTSIAHYSISIIRGVGIDKNAMDYILVRHDGGDIQFVDGWTGKGAICNQLIEAMKDYPSVSPGLAVLSDPAHVAELWGTREDFLIASSCLNSTVSGLLSRTFLRKDIIGPKDFHGAVFYSELAGEDQTYSFIDTVEAAFDTAPLPEDGEEDRGRSGLEEVREICREFNIKDINLVKPSIGEATRVLLRRLPWKVLVHSLDDEEHLGHIYRLAAEKGVELVLYPLRNYKACGLIRSLSDA
ncbi:cysteine protease StiP family protein [bacterium]|nr:cysteine protease StiP family protein [bacterium]